MFTPDVIEHQFREAESRWLASDSRDEAIEASSSDIYTKLLNGQVVYVNNSPYSIDDVIEEMCSQPTFATIVITALTMEEEAGKDLAKTTREEAQKLANQLAEDLYDEQLGDVI